MLRTGKPLVWGPALAVLRRTLAVALLGCTGMASAAMVHLDNGVSFDEVAMDSIFSQTSFAGHNIDIRFNPAKSIVAPGLLSINSDAEFSGPAPSLSDLANQLGIPNFTVSVFYVDAINFCSVSGTNIIGCGSDGGGLIALQSAAAGGANGAALMAHELGHNLGLDHFETSSANLMYSSITGNTTLTSDQVHTFLNPTGDPISSIVRKDAAGLYISITPIAVLAVAAPVPEPQTWAMLSLGLIGVAGWARRRRAWVG